MGSSSKVISQVSFSRARTVVDFVGLLRAEVQNAEAEDALPITNRFESSKEEQVEEQIVEPKEELLEEVELAPEIKEALTQPIAVEMQSKTAVVEEKADDFASHIDGLLAIAPRCPEHEHVELALDSKGQLHILADAEDLRDASIVAGWTSRHQSLLSLACGGLQIDASNPVQHLFTNDAVAVADLHGSGVKLHLLTMVEVAGNKGLFSTPLN
jgi:hypothetical protein